MCLLQTWYGLSDYEVEDRVNDSISFGYFCGLTLEQPAPDHSTLSRFRKTLTEAKAFEPLFKLINTQLEQHKIIVKTEILFLILTTNSCFSFITFGFIHSTFLFSNIFASLIV